MTMPKFTARLARLEPRHALPIRYLWIEGDGRDGDLDAREADMRAQGFDVMRIGWAEREAGVESKCTD